MPSRRSCSTRACGPARVRRSVHLGPRRSSWERPAEPEGAAMKYMLLMVGVHADDDPAETAAPNPPASSAADPDEPCWMPWYREMTARGAHLLQGDRLQPASTATTVELVNGDVLLS